MFSNGTTSVGQHSSSAPTSSRPSRSSPYNTYVSYPPSSAAASTASTAAASNGQQSSGYQDYGMYGMDPTMAWHAAAYSANLYRGYEAAAAAEAVWPPHPHHQSHPHSFMTAASSNGIDPLDHLQLTASDNFNRHSPTEYKFNNDPRPSEDTAASKHVRPSPDSGLAVSDGMSSSGSPLQLNSQQQQQQQQQALSSLATPTVSGPPSATPPLTRPQPARSPYEWMKRPNTFQTRPAKEGRTRTKDKYRVVYSDHQRLELEKEFHYSRYITIRRKAELAQGLSLSERQVKIWFQNRRAKERKQMKKRDELLHKEKLEVAATLHAAAATAASGSAAAAAAAGIPHPFSFHHHHMPPHLQPN